MADNIAVKGSSVTGAVQVATDDISGVHYPVYKLAFGADGTVTIVDADNGLPVSLPETANSYVRDEQVLSALQGVIKELRIMNIHLSMMTDNEITRSELD